MVLTYKTGASDRLATYYHDSAAMAELAAELASYLGPAYALNVAAGTAALPILDMHPLAADLLGIDVTRSLTREEVANLLAGKTTRGNPTPGRRIYKSSKDRAALTFTDFTFSAPKSLSIAIALGNEKERIALETAWMRANNKLMRHIEGEIGGARMGDGGRLGTVPGHMAVVQFHHYTARPTKRVADGADTKLIRDGAPLRPGDMQRHIHNLFMHVTITDAGEVRAPDLQTTRGRIHEWGAIGHSFLVAELRAIGVRAEIDPSTGLSHLPNVSRTAVDLFSARTRQAEALARAKAQDDFDGLSAREKRQRVKAEANRARAPKEGQSTVEFWREAAADVGYVHQPVIHPEHRQDLAPAAMRVDAAYEAALPMLEKELERRSTLDWSTIRTMAARGMIAAGAERATEVEDVVTALFERGVRQDGQMVRLLPGRLHGDRFPSATTSLHVAQEREAIAILKAAAADSTASLTLEQVEAAIVRVAARKGYDFTTPHGEEQRAMAIALSTTGRAAAGIGASGAGKGVVLETVIDAHHAAGWSSYGVTVAWRQTHGLKGAGVGKRRPGTRTLVAAGIDPGRAVALDPFLKGVESGRIQLDRQTLLVLDEIGTISTQQVLALARAQARHGFKIIGTGDGAQCASVGAGNTVQLLRHALGAEQIPLLLETVRQRRKEDRDIAKLLRDGQAVEAMQRKDAAGLLVLVPGDYDDAIRAGVDWLTQRQAVNAGQPAYSVGVSVPTNADVYAFGTAYRARQRAAGKLQGGDWIIEAQDQRGETYGLPLAVGDTVRLFNRVNAALAGGTHGNFGDNGTVAEVVGIDQRYGLRLKRADGTVGAVRWASLQDRDTGRVRLGYGSATTIDARQSETLTDHATLTPDGSQAIDGKRIYSADTRARNDNVIITSQGAEKEEVRNRRPMGDPWLATASDDAFRGAIIENIGRNFSRQPEKLLGVDFLDRSAATGTDGVATQQATWFKSTAQPAPTATMQTMQAAVAQSPIKLLPNQDQITRQRRTMRSVAERAKRQVRPAPSPTEIHAAFGEALRAAGMRLRGEPVMNGQWHRVQVEGDRGRKMSGRYRGYTDGRPAGFIENFKTGQATTWRMDRAAPVMTAEQHRQRDADRVARESERQGREDMAAARAAAMWSKARPVSAHPYLTRKGVQAHGVRRTGDGRLVIPMRNGEGVIRNVQTITPSGQKRFVAGGRKHGLYALIGDIVPGQPLLIAEGYATAASLHEATGRPVIVAFDAGNLMPVAQTIRARHPDVSLVFAADNDHQLPHREKPLPNIGIEKATAAAQAVNGTVVAPSFGSLENQPMDQRNPQTDWNDYAATKGKQAVRHAIEAGIAPVHTDARRVAARRATSQPTQAQAQQTALHEAVRESARQSDGAKP